MGNTLSIVGLAGFPSLFTSDDKELDSSIASLQGVSGRVSPSGSRHTSPATARHLQRNKERRQAQQRGTRSKQYELTTANFKNGAATGASAGALHTPLKPVQGGAKKRRESPNKAEVEMQTTPLRQQHGPAHGPSEQQLRKRQSMTGARLPPTQGTVTAGHHNAFDLLSPSKPAGSTQQGQRKQALLPAGERSKQAAQARQLQAQQSRDMDDIDVGSSSSAAAAAHKASIPHPLMYSSNAQVTAKRIEQNLAAAQRTHIPAPASFAHAAAHTPAVQPVVLSGQRKMADVVPSSSRVNGNTSWAAKAGGGIHHRSQSTGSFDAFATAAQFSALASGASNSPFYAISPPPPPPSDLMAAAPAATTPATPAAAATSNILDLSAFAESFGLPSGVDLKDITPEVLAQAAQIVAAQAAAKKAATEAAAAAAAVAVAAPPVPQAPPMMVPVAPPLAPQAPPLAPQAPPIAPSAPAFKRASTLPASSSVSASSKNLKKFHWTALPAGAIEANTLWADLASENLPALNADDIESTFSNAPKAKAAAAASSSNDDMIDCEDVMMDFDADEIDGDESMTTPVKRRAGGASKSSAVKPAAKISLLDAKRSYNVDIALARARMSPIAIRDHIVQLDESILDEESLRMLGAVVPTEEEAKLVASWAQANPSKVHQLATVESFFLVLADVPHVSARIRLLQLTVSFGAQLRHVESWLGIVEQSCKEVHSCKNLKQVLGVVLQIGNTMNQSQGRASAAVAGGFKLSSLAKLKFTKSADNTTTLLHYLVNLVKTRSPDVMQWTSELEHVGEASRVESAMVNAEVKALRDGMRSVETELARCSRVQTRASAAHAEQDESAATTAQANESLSKYLSEFVSEFQPELDALVKRLKNDVEITKNLAKYFGETDIPSWESFFVLIHDFMVAFSQAEAELAAKAAKLREERQRKEHAAMLKARISERRASNMHAMATPSKALMDLSFAAGESFDFGDSSSTPACSAADSRRHTICSILPADSMSGSPATRARRSAIISPRRAMPSTAARLTVVREDALMTSPGLSTRSRTALSSSSAHVLNSPLRSPAVKRPAADSADSMLGSPSKMARTQAPIPAPSLALSMAGKENQ